MKLLIKQPGKVGDILICLPIAKFYADKGFQVHWLCPRIYHELFRYVDYATPIETIQSRYEVIIDLSFGIDQRAPIHRWWLRNKHQFQTFVHVKYHLAEVPVSERYNLVYHRDEHREKELFKMVDHEDIKKYALVHDRSDYGQVPQIHTSLPVIKFAPIGKYTIFDWRLIIENATEIHCIDSSLANFVEVLKPAGRKFFYRVPERTTESWFDFNQWHLIDMNKLATA